MALPQPRRGPKLSLQTETPQVAVPRLSSRRVAMVDPKSPTAFNTLTNVYATAIDRSTPIQAEPLTAINTHIRQPLRIQTDANPKKLQLRTQTPYTATYPETPLTAHPISPMTMEVTFPSTMTATPPLSAGPLDTNIPKFTFTAPDMSAASAKLTLDTRIMSVVGVSTPQEPRTPRRRTTLPATASLTEPPYTHPRALHSILRNSPLPPSSARVPISPRRQSLRLQERAAKRVEYNNPLTQDIINNKYTKSHIDLLVEEASPMTPSVPGVQEQETVLDLALAFTNEETRDGGMTPGPFEEMRRRMAGLGTSSPLTGGIRKKKKKEKKRHWAWTINQDDENQNDEEVGGAIAALRAAEAAAKMGDTETPIARRPTTDFFVTTPTPSCESLDVEMSDSSSYLSDDHAMTPGGMDVDNIPFSDAKDMIQTPIVVRNSSSVNAELEEENVEAGTRRDTPVPPDMLTV